MVIKRGVLVGSFLFSSFLSWPFLRKVLYPPYTPKYQPERRTIIVTGATGNLGIPTSVKLAQHNQRVIMASRNMEKCLQIRREIVYRTNSNNIACRKLDLSSFESINEFVENIEKTETRVDVLINNAAITKPPPDPEYTNEGIEKTLMVNYVGPFYLTLRLLDKLSQTASITQDSRVINVTGKPGKKTQLNLADLNFKIYKYSSKKAYEQSKLALAFFTKNLNEMVMQQPKYKGIYVFAVNPGYTELGDSELRDITWRDHLQQYYETFFKASPENVVGNTIMCAIDPRMGNEYDSGLLYGLYQCGWKWKKPVTDDVKGKNLWNITMDMLKK